VRRGAGCERQHLGDIEFVVARRQRHENVFGTERDIPSVKFAKVFCNALLALPLAAVTKLSWEVHDIFRDRALCWDSRRSDDTRL